MLMCHFFLAIEPAQKLFPGRALLQQLPVKCCPADQAKSGRRQGFGCIAIFLAPGQADKVSRRWEAENYLPPVFGDLGQSQRPADDLEQAFRLAALPKNRATGDISKTGFQHVVCKCRLDCTHDFVGIGIGVSANLLCWGGFEFKPLFLDQLATAPLWQDV